ncbi:alpha/beta hydrolase [Salinibacter grassmerensis]|uniref:alpha/beta hydrolase n=1 Tax=Salinibacter grassmerensis TaxID=3040353 RepID=UPI0021E76874|nr:alpha/beta hydrolase [Salinibacter grassmerensis]
MPPSTEADTFRTYDGLSLATRQWMPSGPPKAHVLLVHGYAEHCGRYDHVADALVGQGAAVHAYDQRGHGRSEGRQAYVDHFEQYLADLDAFRLHVAPEDEKPVVLFGHSMGGLVTLLYVLNRRPEVHGLLLSAPAIEVNPDLAPVLRRTAQVLGRFAPTLPTVRSPQGSISRDPAVLEDAMNDPLNYHGRTLARTGAELLRAGNEAQHRLHELTTPFLVFHGTADPLVSPTGSRHLHEQASAPDKTLKLYDGLYHETLNEPEREHVLGDVSTWLAERLPTDPTP